MVTLSRNTDNNSDEKKRAESSHDVEHESQSGPDFFHSAVLHQYGRQEKSKSHA